MFFQKEVLRCEIWKVCDFVDKSRICFFSDSASSSKGEYDLLHIRYLLELPPSQDASGKERFSLGFPSLKMTFLNPGGKDCILHGGVYQKYLHLDPMFHPPDPPSRHSYPAGAPYPAFPPGGRFSMDHFVPPEFAPMAGAVACVWLGPALFFWKHPRLGTIFFQAS